MGGASGAEGNRYVSLKDLEVGLGTGDVANGGFVLCFWLYIDCCGSYPSPILVQKHPDVVSSVPFLWLDDEKRVKLFPLLFLYEEAPDASTSVPCATIPGASASIEFPLQKWVHVGCEFLCDSMRLYLDGEIVGQHSLSCSSDKGLQANALEKLHLACPHDDKNTFDGYVYGLEVLCQTSAIKNHHAKDPPVQLSIDYSGALEIEEDGDGVWCIIGGKASCRRIFSVDVVLLDAFGCPVNREFQVVASLLYADTEAYVADTDDGDPPILVTYDGVEYACNDKPCKLTNGRASFKLKICQLSSKCHNRLFKILFDVTEFGRFPFLEALSLPVRCISRSKNSRTTTLSRNSSDRNNYISRCESSSVDDGSMELIPSIVREAKPSPSSKRIKLGHDVPLAMFKEEMKQAHKGHDTTAWTSDEGNTHVVNMDQRPENQHRVENNSSISGNSEATNSALKSSITNPISDLLIFKYCLGGLAERFHLLKEIAISASEEQLDDFAKQVSMFTGCFHHWHQIKIAKRLVEEGIQVWTSIPKNNNNHVLWESLVPEINERFKKIACCTRPLVDQDFDCLRKIFGCQDVVSQENFERMWSWIYPVAFTLSQDAVNLMWNSMSPVWMEGFITKEEAELALQGSGCLADPGTFVLRFPTTRIWPHPDAGNLVVTYVGSDYTIHHRLLSLDFINSCSSEETAVKPLHEFLLEEPELSRLGRMIMNHH